MKISKAEKHHGRYFRQGCHAAGQSEGKPMSLDRHPEMVAAAHEMPIRASIIVARQRRGKRRENRPTWHRATALTMTSSRTALCSVYSVPPFARLPRLLSARRGISNSGARAAQMRQSMREAAQRIFVRRWRRKASKSPIYAYDVSGDVTV